MKKISIHWFWLLAGVIVATAARAQAPSVTGIVPAPNARSAPRTGPLTVSFSQPLVAASVGALKVFSSQRGGLRTRGNTPANISGNALSFVPFSQPFMPGETVQYTVTTAAGGSGGALAQPQVGQFTAAVGGSGTGNFQLGFSQSMGGDPGVATTGDIDGDGDLDLVSICGGTYAVNISKNNGAGKFTQYSYLFLSTVPYVSVSSLVVGDLDGDGDLDLIASLVDYNNVLPPSTVVCFNNGTGTFGGPQANVAGTSLGRMQLGDVDGDGDLDLVGSATVANQVAICLNDGTGTFSTAPNVPTGVSGPVRIGDLDNDGDLDLVTLCFSCQPAIYTVSINNGSGTFTSRPLTLLNLASAQSLLLADMDGDGYLDLLLTSSYGDVVVGRNAGTGSFSIWSSAGSGVYGYVREGVVGDVDGDGDLDYLVPTSIQGSSSGSTPAGVVTVFLNNGSGQLSSGPSVSVRYNPTTIALADADGDLDLDLIVGNTEPTNNHQSNASLATTYLNGIALATANASAPPAATLYPNPGRGSVTLTGALPRTAVTVVNALGSQVYSTTTDAKGAASLLPASLAPGLYVVRAGSQALRLVVE